MCDFCKHKYDYVKLYGRTREGSKNNIAQEQERNLLNEHRKKYDSYVISDTKSIDIVVETGDSFCKGIIEDVSYCPYCGEKL